MELERVSFCHQSSIKYTQVHGGGCNNHHHVGESKAGTRIGDKIVGILMFVYDLTLTADSIENIQILLEVVGINKAY